MHKAGLPNHDWQVFAANFAAHACRVGHGDLFGGLALWRSRGAGRTSGSSAAVVWADSGFSLERARALGDGVSSVSS